jgi:hypothetical protein
VLLRAQVARFTKSTNTTALVRSALRELGKMRLFPPVTGRHCPKRQRRQRSAARTAIGQRKNTVLDLESEVALHIATVDKQGSLELDPLEYLRRPVALLSRAISCGPACPESPKTSSRTSQSVTVSPRPAWCTAGGFRRGRRVFTVDVTGGVNVNLRTLKAELACDDQGPAYVADVEVRALPNAGRPVPVLRSFNTADDGLFLYFPERSQIQLKLRVFIDMLRVLSSHPAFLAEVLGPSAGSPALPPSTLKL